MSDLYRVGDLDVDGYDTAYRGPGDVYQYRVAEERLEALIDDGVLVKVEPTESIKWCFAHEEELGTNLSICDRQWRRNEHLARMGEEAQQNCDIGDALLVRIGDET